jgi:hypothetical protein
MGDQLRQHDAERAVADPPRSDDRPCTAPTGCPRQAAGPATRSTGRSRRSSDVPPECPSPPAESCPAAGHVQVMGVSRPVGRVLCLALREAAVIHLGPPLPTASCGLPAGIGRAALKRSRRHPGLSRKSPLDLAPGGVYQAAPVTWGAGGLLHHRFTLTPPLVKNSGAVCFLWHCPAGHPGSALPTTLPCGARTFLTGPRGPARPPGRLTRRQDTAR